MIAKSAAWTTTITLALSLSFGLIQAWSNDHPLARGLKALAEAAFIGCAMWLATELVLGLWRVATS